MEKINQFLEKVKQVQKCKTADGIARFLKKRKIKGHTNMSGSCPLAKYFFGVNKKGLGSVAGDNIEFLYNEGGIEVEIRIDPTQAISEFVQKFDDGKYPSLDLEQ